MRSATLLGLLVVGVLAVSFAPKTQAQGLGDLLSGDGLVSALTSQLVGLWQQGEIELLGNYCNFSVTPRIKKWQLYFRGRMWCPGWTPLRGEAETRSRSGVVNDTVRDFVQKALQSGLISEREANDWLNSRA